MAIFHKQALIELEKENPNMQLIDAILKEMKDMADKNKSNH